MKVLILFCVVAAAFANPQCNKNEHYESCGTACPLTCENYDNPPQICVLRCDIGCFCDDGYVRNLNGRCVKPEQCSSRNEPVAKTCSEKPDSGMCLAYMPQWFYDIEKGQCFEFVYGGCQGNGNRYATEEECLSHCGTVAKTCSEKPDTGMCMAYNPQWFYDIEKGQCYQFVYGGCQGNGNRYATEEDCLASCGKECGENKVYKECGSPCPLTCDNYDNPPKICPAMCVSGCHCETGYVKTKDGRCVRPESCSA